MTLIEQTHEEHKARRLRMAANAVPDDGIDLKRRPVAKWLDKPAPEPIPEPIEEKTVQEIPLRDEAALIAALQAEVEALKAKIQSGITILPQPEAAPDEPPLVVRPTVARIKAIVAAFYGISPLDMESVQRQQRICRPRMIAVHLSCRLTTRSLPFIGRQFGDRDHSTCLHARDKITKLRENDDSLNAELLALEQRIMLHAKPEIKDAA